jgi:hypothetical protein
MVVVAARGDQWTIAVCRHYLARVAAAQGDTAEAFGLLAEALAFFRQWEDRRSSPTGSTCSPPSPPTRTKRSGAGA